MIKNKELLEEFERELIRKEKVDFNKNLAIFSQLLNLAKTLKKLPLSDPLEDIEIDIKYAKVINGIKRTS